MSSAGKPAAPRSAQCLESLRLRYMLQQLTALIRFGESGPFYLMYMKLYIDAARMQWLLAVENGGFRLPEGENGGCHPTLSLRSNGI